MQTIGHSLSMSTCNLPEIEVCGQNELNLVVLIELRESISYPRIILLLIHLHPEAEGDISSSVTCTIDVPFLLTCCSGRVCLWKE